MGGRRRRRAAPYGREACVAPAVAVSGPQRPVVGGRRGEVSGVDIGCGVGCAQRCVSSVRRRMVRLCSLRDLTERPHRGGQ